MTTHAQLFAQLDHRRSRLGLSKVQLAARSGVSVPTVHRLFSGSDESPRLDTLSALAGALGVEVHLGKTPAMYESTKVRAYREAQARAKASKLTRLVQGTMALEAEAVDDAVLEQITEENVLALLTGPASRLWAD